MIRFNPTSGIAGSRGVRKKHNWSCRAALLANSLIALALVLYMVVVFELTVMSMDYNTEASEPISFSAVRDDANYTITDAQVSNFSFDDLHHHLDCYAHAKSQNKPMYTAAMWQHMVQKYSEITGDMITHKPLPQSTFHVGRSAGAGRGVFASRDIAKGEIIPFDKTISIVTFDDGVLWKKFVVSLPGVMACDVMEWSWTQEVFKEGNMKICLSIGDGDSFLNAGDDETNNLAPINMTSLQFWAVRDIKKGEELAFDYDVFETRYELFGLR